MKKKEEREWFQLPDGTNSRSKQRHTRECRAAGKLFARELRLPFLLAAFDPGFKFRDETNGSYVEVPHWLVVAFTRRFTIGKTGGRV